MSFAGIVESVGSDVTNFRPGDKIATVRDGSKGGDLRFGAFQQYALASQYTTSKLPESVTLEEAAASILNLAAVASALSIHIKLQRPSLTKPADPQSSKILIYGGSGSAGGLAVCYARAAGYRVITTSSLKNKDYVQHLGPIAVIDHNQHQENLVKEIESHGPYEIVFDASGLPVAVDVLGEYMHANGGGTFYTLDAPDRPLPDDVKRYFAPYSLWMDKPEHHDFRAWFYTELVPKGLKTGIIVPTRPRQLEGGLSQVQKGLDTLMEGQISGAKILLDLSSE